MKAVAEMQSERACVISSIAVDMFGIEQGIAHTLVCIEVEFIFVLVLFFVVFLD